MKAIQRKGLGWEDTIIIDTDVAEATVIEQGIPNYFLQTRHGTNTLHFLTLI